MINQYILVTSAGYSGLLPEKVIEQSTSTTTGTTQLQQGTEERITESEDLHFVNIHSIYKQHVCHKHLMINKFNHAAFA